MAADEITYHVCPLCEATCGLAVETKDNKVVNIRGDNKDPFSKGYLCPKAYALKALHEDADRLRQPVIRSARGWEPIEWDTAYEIIREKLNDIRARHGADSLGLYLGNPFVHSLHMMVYSPFLVAALGTKQFYSASSVDVLPKLATCALMYGDMMLPTVPDIDRTDYFLMLGSNPMISNGSLMTAPGCPKRLKGIKSRGGKIIVIDPRRTETAELADEHVFIKPGTDPYFLLAFLHTIFDEKLAKPGRLEKFSKGLARVEEVVAPYSPETVASKCRVPAQRIRRLVREFCAAKRAVCYGRVGTCCQEFGSLAIWASEVINIVTGNLDKPGGSMFARPAATFGAALPLQARRSGTELNRWQSPVGGLPEILGELPLAALANEIDAPSDKRIRGLITIAGNPALSAPNGSRMQRALQSLDFMVSVDFYLNETTRHANLILPSPDPLERDTYDLVLYHYGVRNVAKYSPAALQPPHDMQQEWEILLKLIAGARESDNGNLAAVDNAIVEQVAKREIVSGGRWQGLTAAEAIDALEDGPGSLRVLDLLLRLGPYGDGFGRNPRGLTLRKLKKSKHGRDFGALKRCLPEVLRTRDGQIDLSPDWILKDLRRLEGGLTGEDSEFVLIGRRTLRSNNSWMHNLPLLVKGPDRCTLLVNAADAARLNLTTGGFARVTSRVGSVNVAVEVSDEMMPGVVSLPHGWGHDLQGTRMPVASAHSGVSSGVLVDDEVLDTPSGTAVLNGIPVTVVVADNR